MSMRIRLRALFISCSVRDATKIKCQRRYNSTAIFNYRGSTDTGGLSTVWFFMVHRTLNEQSMSLEQSF
jgi:hypothetical protein